MANYYEILGVESTASQLEIKRAFRRKALELHPDKNHKPDARERFIQLTEAFEVLREPRIRKHYDDLISPNFPPNPSQKTKWESDIKDKTTKAREKGKHYADNFDYFSKKVIKQTFWMLAIEVVLSVIFADVSNGILLPLLFLIGGPYFAYINIDEIGTVAALLVGSSSAIIGFFWARYQIRALTEE